MRSIYSPVPAAGLAGHSPAAGFPLDSVARQYSFWHDAGAFGGGQVGAAAGEGVHVRRGLMRLATWAADAACMH